MALVRTTLSAAVTTASSSIVVASATGFAAGYRIRIDDEIMQVVSTYLSGTTIGVLRGQDGTAVDAHPATAGVVCGIGSDWPVPADQTLVQNPLAGRNRTVASYSASGAIALPVSGADVFAILNGTSVLTMTVAAPGKDLDGSILWITGNGIAAHTINFASGLGGSGGSYDILTTNAGGPIAIVVVAANEKWMVITAPAWTGTVTNIVGAIA